MKSNMQQYPKIYECSWTQSDVPDFSAVNLIVGRWLSLLKALPGYEKFLHAAQWRWNLMSVDITEKYSDGLWLTALCIYGMSRPEEGGWQVIEELHVTPQSL